MVAIERVGIVGCGLMGSGIAELCIRAECDVIVREVDETAIDSGRRRIERSLQQRVTTHKISEQTRQQALARLSFTTDYGAFESRQLVIEAIIESEPAKLAVFEQLDAAIATPDAILASNTNAIPIMKLAMATQRPEAVCGLHFFNPVQALKLVELVTSLVTSSETADRAGEFAHDILGRYVIRSQDRAGFVVNRLLIPYILASIRMVESGFSTKEDIDAGMRNGCNHPMGPLQVADLIGLDTVLAVAESLYAEFKDPLCAPPPLLTRMVEENLLGRKTQRGFYNYGESYLGRREHRRRRHH